MDNICQFESNTNLSISDDDELFSEQPDPEPTRRSTRIPVMQQQKHDKVSRIVRNRNSVTGDEDEDEGETGGGDSHTSGGEDDDTAAPPDTGKYCTSQPPINNTSKQKWKLVQLSKTKVQ